MRGGDIGLGCSAARNVRRSVTCVVDPSGREERERRNDNLGGDVAEHATSTGDVERAGIDAELFGVCAHVTTDEEADREGRDDAGGVVRGLFRSHERKYGF